MWWSSPTVLVWENLKQKQAVPFHFEGSRFPGCHHWLDGRKTCSRCYGYLGARFGCVSYAIIWVFPCLILSWRLGVIRNETDCILPNKDFSYIEFLLLLVITNLALFHIHSITIALKCEKCLQILFHDCTLQEHLL